MRKSLGWHVEKCDASAGDSGGDESIAEGYLAGEGGLSAPVRTSARYRQYMVVEGKGGKGTADHGGKSGACMEVFVRRLYCKHRSVCVRDARPPSSYACS